MKIKAINPNIEKKIINSKNLLFIQDIDGVCIPLVKDPLKRVLERNYILASKLLEEEFFVLTCGEHEGKRGVNRIIERALNKEDYTNTKGFYLPGLAACGVEYQDCQGNISFEGISQKELNFLSKVPSIMRPEFISIIKRFFPEMKNKEIEEHIQKSICSTKFSPTINLNSLFELIKNNSEKTKAIQKKCLLMMEKIISQADLECSKGSFFLHISPNLGKSSSKEIMKFSTSTDIGSTDIQFLVRGAVKDAGVLCLLNKYIGKKTGVMPFGKEFNFRNVPESTEEKISFCKKYIKKDDMPMILGVGDTVTSKKEGDLYQRGGSDRSFLELIYLLGKEFEIENKIFFVDSSSGEVFRPSTKETGLDGITDKDDMLKFDFIFQGGPKEYINWFINISKKRYHAKKSSIN